MHKINHFETTLSRLTSQSITKKDTHAINNTMFEMMALSNA